MDSKNNKQDNLRKRNKACNYITLNSVTIVSCVKHQYKFKPHNLRKSTGTASLFGNHQIMGTDDTSQQYYTYKENCLTKSKLHVTGIEKSYLQW